MGVLWTKPSSEASKFLDAAGLESKSNGAVEEHDAVHSGRLISAQSILCGKGQVEKVINIEVSHNCAVINEKSSIFTELQMSAKAGESQI